MKVVEKFVSINGEGTRAGELSVFLRFKGCNLRCSYCDTVWAYQPDCSYREESPEELLQYVIESGVHNVTITGGEPLLQPEAGRLISLLVNHKLPECNKLRGTSMGKIFGRNRLHVEIETNGAVDLKPFCHADRPVFTMDYKLPSSGCEEAMCLSNFALLMPEDTVKFVVGSLEDLDRAREIIEEYDLTNHCHVYFSPVFGAIEPVKIVEEMIKYQLNGVRMQIQMHKVIWDPEKRGV